ncbi:hypothetical protein [Paenibacillus alginolyticus]|uniref:hypothetical protein n=1 Tax=Paenibacillus alginolyticus TaxID=59839 RepID=UPI0015671B90|nr:hypothetical protein [Paenibacillus frigoriresistens]
MRKILLSLMTVITLIIPFFTNAITTHAASYSDLAAYWAPQIYQDVRTLILT